MSTQLMRWKIRLRRLPMATQLARSRSSRRETRYLLSSPANARRLREGIAQLNARKSVLVEFDANGNLRPASGR